MYRKSLNRSLPQIEVCLKLTPGGIAEVIVIDAGLKLKPGRGLHMYEVHLCISTCLQWHVGVTTWHSS